ncbi:multidrug MFS transporter [Anaerosporomusa subterranea]|uniref:Multidrug MFS transporter n=1 Tax=Anaerosporomusa subterranea TaxID=1794912 RepID=A0A154BWC9_ANASB|nr:MFS transporter [Anaerosporomusa subterranea]KYZ78227.1 multidrug MFS transporter [Anaerosporomusa subterranea]
MEHTDIAARRWLVFAVTAVGTFMSTLDSSIVNVAMPTLAAELSASIDLAQWVVTAYLLAITSLLLPFGRLGDMIGRRKVYSFGFLIFTAGSALCAVSAGIVQLIAARVTQAVGAAMLMANAPAIITLAFPPEGRGQALGMSGTVVALGSMTGPALGGILVGAFGWESVFTINLPIGLAGAVFAWMLLPDEAGKHSEPFDSVGAGLFGLAMTALLLSVSLGQSRGWLSLTISGGLTFAVIAFWLFITHQRKTDYPMLDLSLFKRWPFSTGILSGMLSFMAGFSNVFLLPFFLDSVLSLSPSLIGLLLTPFPLVMALSAPVSGRLSERANPAVLTTVGLLVLTAGLWLQAGLTEQSSIWQVAIGQALLGLGNGIFQSPNNNSVMSSVPRNKVGVAGGINALVRNLGMVLGIAIAVTIFESVRQGMLHQGDQASIIAGYRAALLTGSLFSLSGAALSVSRNRGQTRHSE